MQKKCHFFKNCLEMVANLELQYRTQYKKNSNKFNEHHKQIDENHKNIHEHKNKFNEHNKRIIWTQ